MSEYETGEHYITPDGSQVYWWDGGERWRLTDAYAGDYEFVDLVRLRDMPEGLLSLTDYSRALWVERNVAATFGSVAQLRFECCEQI